MSIILASQLIDQSALTIHLTGRLTINLKLGQPTRAKIHIEKADFDTILSF